jgi:hypothetical protein
MLIPDNIHPEQTVYFMSSFILTRLFEVNSEDIFDLYLEVDKQHKMSLPVFFLCIDWLYLINVVQINDHGKVVLCI